MRTVFNRYPGFSRREFLSTAIGVGGAILHGPALLNAAADEVDVDKTSAAREWG
jgi:hypothetical protein